MTYIARQVRQNCPKCNGAGTDPKKPKLIDGKQSVVQFDKKTEVSVFENCPTCEGQGQTLQNVPKERVVEGERAENPILNNRPVIYA